MDLETKILKKEKRVFNLESR